MPYLIDGNNLIGSFGEHSAPITRGQLTHQLCEFARKKGCHVIVVYDGEPDHVLPGNTQYLGRVVTIFSGAGKSADLTLKEIIARKEQADAILVTSDLELGEFSAQHGAESIKSHLFLHMLRSYTEPPDQDDGIEEELSPREIQEWIEYFQQESQSISSAPQNKKT